MFSDLGRFSQLYISVFTLKRRSVLIEFSFLKALIVTGIVSLKASYSSFMNAVSAHFPKGINYPPSLFPSLLPLFLFSQHCF